MRLIGMTGVLIAAAGVLCGCANAPREHRLPPCTASSPPTDICDATHLPAGLEYPKPQEDQGRPTQAQRDIERHRAQPGD